MAFEPTPENVDAIRTALKRTLDRASETIVPAGHHGALVAHFGTDIIRVASAQRIGDGWQVGEFVEYDRKSASPTIGVEILKTW